MRFIIDIHSSEEASFVSRLLRRLNISFIAEEPVRPSAQAAAFEALGAVARRGEVARLIPDPSAWQDRERQDRELPFHG